MTKQTRTEAARLMAHGRAWAQTADAWSKRDGAEATAKVVEYSKMSAEYYKQASKMMQGKA